MRHPRCLFNQHGRYVDGNVYHGEFFEDEVHGRGRLTICPGSILEEVYDGEFHRGVKHGRGIYVYRKGEGLVREPLEPFFFSLARWFRSLLCFVADESLSRGNLARLGVLRLFFCVSLVA